MKKIQLSVEDIQEILGISKSHAYKIIRDLNEELKEKGFYVVRGKISSKYFNEKYYGILE